LQKKAIGLLGNPQSAVTIKEVSGRARRVVVKSRAGKTEIKINTENEFHRNIRNQIWQDISGKPLEIPPSEKMSKITVDTNCDGKYNENHQFRRRFRIDRQYRKNHGSQNTPDIPLIKK